jgi:glutamine---fructose-6-phosphate transaminase (isomerizing)
LRAGGFRRRAHPLAELNLTPELARRIKKIFITACGTAAHAGMVGKVLIERIARLPVEVDIASEFRYRDPIVDEDTVVLAISQSGETADTLAAMEEGRRKGATLWSIVNAIGSQAMRIADGYISMQSGPEIGVASTKAYTAPLVDLYMLAILLGDLRGTLDAKSRRQLIADLRLVPDLAGRCLDREAEVERVARNLMNVKPLPVPGARHQYAHRLRRRAQAERDLLHPRRGLPGGRDEARPDCSDRPQMPVVVIAPRDPWYEKMFSQIEQAKARGGVVVALATDGDELIPA